MQKIDLKRRTCQRTKLGRWGLLKIRTVGAFTNASPVVPPMIQLFKGVWPSYIWFYWYMCKTCRCFFVCSVRNKIGLYLRYVNVLKLLGKSGVVHCQQKGKSYSFTICKKNWLCHYMYFQPNIIPNDTYLFPLHANLGYI